MRTNSARWLCSTIAGLVMCRAPESREEHFRLEKELLALADSKERLHGARASEQACYPQQSK
jgi:hypothetical protein